MTEEKKEEEEDEKDVESKSKRKSQRGRREPRSNFRVGSFPRMKEKLGEGRNHDLRGGVS